MTDTEYQFVSRRTLVLRRFLRNRPAVISLALLSLLFVSCWCEWGLSDRELPAPESTAGLLR